jgi:predicted O-linked N-acetylglucosamine transferase (SPINDLY family)
LHTHHITFGCFNALPKITEAMLALWLRVLLAVPGSRLLLKNLGFGDPATLLRTRALLEKAGFTPEHVELAVPPKTSADHLATYGRVDIALDTFPCHGTTTTCEALWMGVPVITLRGETHTSRVGASLLGSLNLRGLIASQPEEYIRIARDLGTDVPRLETLRSTLRERMAASPLMDAPRFARNLEQAYREMWREWCAGRRTAQTPR